MKLKNILCIGLIGSLILSLAGCGKKTSTYQPLDEDDDSVYNITVCQSEDSDTSNALTSGFSDALTDILGEKHVKINVQIVSDSLSADDICSDGLANNTQLIFANGGTAISAATEATEDTPIVGAGIMDFQKALHIVVPGNSKWDKKSGTNVTGVTAVPPISQQLSELIESADEVEPVGILYSADDVDAIYQNEILEKYLNQAGIAWREYKLPSEADIAAANLEANDSDNNDSDSSDDEKTSSAIAPSKIVAHSAMEGSNMNVEPIGENGIISGINNPDSVRSPLVSPFWYGPKGTSKPDALTGEDEENADNSDEDEENASNSGEDTNDDADTENEDATADTQEDADTDTTPELEVLPDDASVQDVIDLAVKECNILYIPAQAKIASHIEEITDTAKAANVPVFGGDTQIGQYTLTSLFIDPYHQGYAAGKIAYRILVNGDEPGEIKIAASAGSAVKLYNKDYADTLKKEFPKSFSEYSEYLSTYQMGDTTNRISTESKDEDE